MMAANTYTDRVIQHSLKWVNGRPEHNHVDGECVADFSCCHPKNFTGDREKRMRSHRLLLEKLGRSNNTAQGEE